MEQSQEYLALSRLEREFADELLAELEKVQSVQDLLFKISCVELDNSYVDHGRKVALNYYLSQHVTF